MNTRFPQSEPLCSRARSGSTLVATMIVVTVLVTFLSISALLTSQFSRFGSRQAGYNDMQAAADAGLEYVYAAWCAAVKKGTVTSLSVTADTLNTTSLPFNANGVTFSNVAILPADQNGVATGVSMATKAAGTVTSNVPDYPGWSGTTYNYLAKVTVTGSRFGFAASAPPALTCTRTFQYTLVPLFQAAIFYQNKLEIHPGAAMTVSGPVHTNSDLYARGFNTLQFKSNVSYVGKYNEIGEAAITKGWDGSGGGVIPGVGAYASVPMVTWSDGLTSTTSTAKASQLNQVNPIDPFGGASTNNNGLHDIVEVPTSSPPPINSTAAVSSIAYNNAALVITVDSSKNAGSAARLRITDNQGNALSAADTAAVTAAVSSGNTTTIYDQRETGNVVLTTLDMSKLALATVVQPGKTATALQNAFAGNNAVVYIHDVSTSGTAQPAVRLVNGRDLGQDVTIASDNGVYIQGDYNTGGTKAADVPSNVSNPNGSAVPQASTYSRYSSAVLADAVTILSNNWSDTNSSLPLATRIATPTTVNTAILAGDVPSNLNGNKTASGGAHNFPRFLENWNNINFTYWGSLVEGYRSEEFTGLWQTGNVYYWPNRMWNFDTNFIDNPPPGTASGIQFSRGRWQRD